MRKDQFYEMLAKLYLRLNGYFQSGLISHSATWGNNGTEVDSLAVRFPLHRQPERTIGCCPKLKIPQNRIDLVYAEVKSASVKFNPSLKPGHPHADQNWRQILQWTGMFEDVQIDRIIPDLQAAVNLDGSNFEGILVDTTFGQAVIRPIIFSFENPDPSAEAFMNGSTVIDFIWDCFCPEYKRKTCSTAYATENWGTEFSTVVKYFKHVASGGTGKPSIQELTSALC